MNDGGRRGLTNHDAPDAEWSSSTSKVAVRAELVHTANFRGQADEHVIIFGPQVSHAGCLFVANLRACRDCWDCPWRDQRMHGCTDLRGEATSTNTLVSVGRRLAPASAARTRSHSSLAARPASTTRPAMGNEQQDAQHAPPHVMHHARYSQSGSSTHRTYCKSSPLARLRSPQRRRLIPRLLPPPPLLPASGPSGFPHGPLRARIYEPHGCKRKSIKTTSLPALVRVLACLSPHRRWSLASHLQSLNKADRPSLTAIVL